MNHFHVDFQGLGINFLHKAMLRFHPKWSCSLHVTKNIKFDKHIIHPDTPVTVYTTTFKGLRKELAYNSLSYHQDNICTQFINNLGVDFTNICNKDPHSIILM